MSMGRSIVHWMAWALAFGIAYFAVQLYGLPYVFGQLPAETAGQEPGLTGSARDAFVGGAIRTCNKQQLNAPENASIEKPILISYCTCYDDGMADRVSLSQLRANDGLTDNEKLAKMKPAIEAASSLCLEELEKALQNNTK